MAEKKYLRSDGSWIEPTLLTEGAWLVGHSLLAVGSAVQTVGWAVARWGSSQARVIEPPVRERST